MRRKVKLKIGETEEFTEGIIRLFTAMHLESSRLILNRSHQHVSVHETRKNIKKIRGMLRLIRHEIGKTQFHDLNAYYREIAAVVAVLRDDTSQIELLQGMREAVQSPQVRRSLGKAIRQVKVRRKIEFAHFYGNNTQLKVHDTLKAKAVEYEGLIIAGDPEAFILKGLRKTYRQARKALKATIKSGNKEVYHALRKQVKYLMYHMMTISNSLTTELKEFILLLDRLSDYLGNLHDLDLFHEHLKEDELIKLEKDKKQMVLKYIYRRRAYLKRNTHKLGKTLFSENSKVFAKRVFDDWNSARQS